ncbi:hypothetical protein SLS54_003756 [Diplodia seriata]
MYELSMMETDNSVLPITDVITEAYVKYNVAKIVAVKEEPERIDDTVAFVDHDQYSRSIAAPTRAAVLLPCSPVQRASDHARLTISRYSGSILVNDLFSLRRVRRSSVNRSRWIRTLTALLLDVTNASFIPYVIIIWQVSIPFRVVFPVIVIVIPIWFCRNVGFSAKPCRAFLHVIVALEVNRVAELIELVEIGKVGVIRPGLDRSVIEMRGCMNEMVGDVTRPELFTRE